MAMARASAASACGLAEFEQRAHHVLYLRLFGRAGADHGLFDLPRRILEHFQILIHRRHDRDAARLAELERRIRVLGHKHLFDGEEIGLKLVMISLTPA